MPLLSWDFNITDENKKTLALVNKNFTGIAREIFTDTSQYLVDLPADTNLTAAKKSIVIGCAVSIDCDYFSKLSGGPGLFPFFFYSTFPSGDSSSTSEPLDGAGPDTSPMNQSPFIPDSKPEDDIFSQWKDFLDDDD